MMSEITIYQSQWDFYDHLLFYYFNTADKILNYLNSLQFILNAGIWKYSGFFLMCPLCIKLPKNVYIFGNVLASRTIS